MQVVVEETGGVQNVIDRLILLYNKVIGAGEHNELVLDHINRVQSSIAQSQVNVRRLVLFTSDPSYQSIDCEGLSAGYSVVLTILTVALFTLEKFKTAADSRKQVLVDTIDRFC